MQFKDLYASYVHIILREISFVLVRLTVVLVH